MRAHREPEMSPAIKHRGMPTKETLASFYLHVGPESLPAVAGACLKIERPELSRFPT